MKLIFNHIDEVTNWPWPFFKPSELACRGTGKLVIEEEFMDRLHRLRTIYGEPLKASSGYRDPIYNVQVSKTGPDGPHTTGRAVDILIFGPNVYRLVKDAMALGFTGIGIHQRGNQNSRFVHLDDIVSSIHPRPRIWSY